MLDCGGFEGRQLKRGDIMDVQEKALPVHRLKERGSLFKPSTLHQIKIFKGPEYPTFNESDLKTLLTTKYEVSAQSNRMGIRLKGRCNK